MGNSCLEADIARILNAAWMVRHHQRGGRMTAGPMTEHRARAIKQLGLVVRSTFNSTENFEPLLAAICDGLRPRDEQPF